MSGDSGSHGARLSWPAEQKSGGYTGYTGCMAHGYHGYTGGDMAHISLVGRAAVVHRRVVKAALVTRLLHAAWCARALVEGTKGNKSGLPRQHAHAQEPI